MNRENHHQSGRLTDRVAIVMGAGSAGPGWSIGKATAVAFARAGARVMAIDDNRTAAADVEALIRDEGGICDAVVADVTVGDDVKRVVDCTMERHGRIDVLHNNVGMARVGGPVELSEEDWLASMWLNVGSAFLACKHILPVMEAQRTGVITTVSTIASKRWIGTAMIGYATFKGALNSFTRTVAMHYAAKGIRANVIIPGRMDTPMLRAGFRSLYPDEETLVADKAAICPTGRLGQPWDVADAAIFLASEEAKYITGIELPVDGGVLCQS
jgi:NAD(P)-dependent dehydrogenase (short-subunit alcohol dehydrogenase family)